VVKEKPVDPQSLLSLIKESLDNIITDSYGSGPLPKNCIYYGVVERNSQSPTQIVAVEREPCIRPYNHIGEIYRVGYPKLVFLYAVQGQMVKQTAVAAAKDEIIKNDSGMYVFPYANVYHNGIVCMGSFMYPPVKQLSDLSYFPEAFYIIEHTHPNNVRGQKVYDLLKAAEDRPFNNDLLVFDCTFEQFVKRFSGTEK